ncbi:hypothetical protein Ahia01_000196500 [Argonauta hians]
MATYGSLLEEDKENTRAPLLEVDHADFLVTNPKTIYKNNRPVITRYEIIINNASAAFPLRSSRDVFRSFKEFKWLRRILKWEYLTSCVKDKKIISDVAFHLFVQSDLTIKDIKMQRSGTVHHSFLPCLWGCGGKIHSKEDDLDYKEFKKELSKSLMNQNSE